VPPLTAGFNATRVSVSLVDTFSPGFSIVPIANTASEYFTYAQFLLTSLPDIVVADDLEYVAPKIYYAALADIMRPSSKSSSDISKLPVGVF